MKNLKEISKLVESCRNLAYIEGNKAKIKKELRKVPEVFVGNSNLFISFGEHDNGTNRFSSQLIIDALSNSITFKEGEHYVDYNGSRILPLKVSCSVKNLGDLAVPSAKVEFYTSGFLHRDVIREISRLSGNMPLGVSDFTYLGVTDCWLNSGETKSVSLDIPLQYVFDFYSSLLDFRRVDLTKLLIIRIFSLSPEDLPTSINTFIMNDKHIAFKVIG
jgi:hypothetical protein